MDLRLRRNGFTLIELMIVISIIGILATIALPEYMKFKARAQQAEPKAMLRGWATAQRAYFAEKNTYSEAIGEIGFTVERANRYQYAFSNSCTYQDRTGPDLGVNAGQNCVTVDQWKYGPVNLAPTPSIPAQTFAGTGADPTTPAGLGGVCPNCNIQGFAAGNLDSESAGIDTWVVGTKDSTLASPGCGGGDTFISAGMPTNTFDDTNCN